MRRIKRLDEEIARWSFELLLKTNYNWQIAYTNPTAGPWKTIKALSLSTGDEGEVYRFTLEETRPDIIMYNDNLEIVIIIEAKDSLGKLIDISQSQKSADVVVSLANILKSKGSNPYWRGRENYQIILGLLWGSINNPESDITRNELFDSYYNLIKDKQEVYTNLIFGVEALYSSENILCTPLYKNYSDNGTVLGEMIIESLGD